MSGGIIFYVQAINYTSMANSIMLIYLAPVVATILAIWEFAETDVLWRTVATCFVVGAGAAVFALVNNVFGDKG